MVSSPISLPDSHGDLGNTFAPGNIKAQSFITGNNFIRPFTSPIQHNDTLDTCPSVYLHLRVTRRSLLSEDVVGSEKFERKAWLQEFWKISLKGLTFIK